MRVKKHVLKCEHLIRRLATSQCLANRKPTMSLWDDDDDDDALAAIDVNAVRAHAAPPATTTTTHATATTSKHSAVESSRNNQPHVWLDLSPAPGPAARLSCSYERLRSDFPGQLARAGIMPHECVAVTPTEERAGASWDVSRDALKHVYDALLRMNAFTREERGVGGRQRAQLRGAPPAKTIEYYTNAPGYRGGRVAALTAPVSHIDVDARFAMINGNIRKSLYPFQVQGVKFAIERHGRVLIADQMGVGKTVQAIAVADAYRDEGPLLCIVPASMRYVWADELERWMPDLTPRRMDVILGSADKFMLQKLARATRAQPTWSGGRRVVVTSYHMLHHLREEFLDVRWGCVIADESHILRTSTSWENDEPKMVLVAKDLIKRAPRAVLTTGTPSLAKPFDMFLQIDCLKPGMLGSKKWDFANHYCDLKKVDGRFNVGGGVRLLELRALLQHTVMIRRLKCDVLGDLPPKRRQVVPVEIDDAIAKVGGSRVWRDIAKIAREKKDEMDYGDVAGASAANAANEDDDDDEDDDIKDVEFVLKEKFGAIQAGNRVSVAQLVGILKVEPIMEWLEHGILADDALQVVIFAHHQAVLDALELMCQRIERRKKGSYVRIDGPMPSVERARAIEKFREGASVNEDGVVDVRVALLSIKASAVGLDFATASAVVFAELPDDPATLAQAESRVHRRGNENGCNVYFMCARGGECSYDEDRWARLEHMTDLCGETLDGDVSRAGLDIDAYGTDIALPGIERASNATAASAESLLKAASDVEILAPSRDERDVELWFEVSDNSGRMHFHAAADCSKPIHASVSRAELLKASRNPNFKATLPEPLASDAAAFASAISFSNTWKAMQTRERNLILARQVACRAHELNDLADALATKPATTNTGGGEFETMRHGKRLAALPKDAEMRCVRVVRGSNQSNIVEMNQPFSFDADTGATRALCVHCACAIDDDDVRDDVAAPKRFVDVFCGRQCFEDYTQMNSASGLRLALFKREGGVCVECKIDCEALVRRIRVLKSRSKRKSEIVKLHPGFGRRGAGALLNRLARTACAGHAWECDHILGVYQGGGMCTVENAQTLCVVCHAAKTKAQAKDRAKLRARERDASVALPASKRPAIGALPDSDSDSGDVVINSGDVDIIGAPVARGPRPHSGIADDAGESDSDDDIDDDDLLAPVFT